MIVSDKGLEGIDAVHGEQVLLAKSADDYLSCLEEVFRGDHPCIGERARRWIVERFNWDENLPEVVYLLDGEDCSTSEEKTASA